MPQLRSDLLALPNELLGEVISYCSVIEVTRLEMTCKYICQICSTSMIWLGLLHKLDIDCAPDLLPHTRIQDLSLSDLRCKVVDAVRGSLSRMGSRHFSINNEKFVRIVTPQNNSDQFVDARLLPGGKEILVLNCSHLELWSASDSTCLWRAPLYRGLSECASFDFELVENGTIIVIVGVYSSSSNSTQALRVFRYNIKKGSAELVYNAELPYQYIFRLTVHGNFCLLYLPLPYRLALIDWKSCRSIFVDFVDSKEESISKHLRSSAIHDGYLIAAGDLDNGLTVLSMPLSVLEEYWSSSLNYTRWRKFLYNPGKGFIIEPPVQDEVGPWVLETRLFTPNWKKNAVTELYIIAHNQTSRMSTLLMSYRLHLITTTVNYSDESSGIGFSLIKSASTPVSGLPWSAHCVTNSGRLMHPRGRLGWFPLFCENPQPLADLKLDMQQYGDVEPRITIEPWSGTIVASVQGLVRVFQLK